MANVETCGLGLSLELKRNKNEPSGLLDSIVLANSLDRKPKKCLESYKKHNAINMFYLCGKKIVQGDYSRLLGDGYDLIKRVTNGIVRGTTQV